MGKKSASARLNESAQLAEFHSRIAYIYIYSLTKPSRSKPYRRHLATTVTNEAQFSDFILYSVQHMLSLDRSKRGSEREREREWESGRVQEWEAKDADVRFVGNDYRKSFDSIIDKSWWNERTWPNINKISLYWLKSPCGQNAEVMMMMKLLLLYLLLALALTMECRLTFNFYRYEKLSWRDDKQIIFNPRSSRRSHVTYSLHPF